MEEFIRELDHEIDMDALASRGRWFSADARSQFHPLGYPQQVALVQQLLTVMLSENALAQNQTNYGPGGQLRRYRKSPSINSVCEGPVTSPNPCPRQGGQEEEVASWLLLVIALSWRISIRFAANRLRRGYPLPWRKSWPGRAAVGFPSSKVTCPFTTVHRYPSAFCIRLHSPPGKS